MTDQIRLRRYRDWPTRLSTYLAQVSAQAFVVGKQDCALFLAGAVAAMTGVDYAAPYRGRYTSLRGGLRILRKDGFADHIELAAHHLREIDPVLVRPGDAVVVATVQGPALGLCQGEAVYVVSHAGLAVVAKGAVLRAFEV